MRFRGLNRLSLGKTPVLLVDGQSRRTRDRAQSCGDGNGPRRFRRCKPTAALTAVDGRNARGRSAPVHRCRQVLSRSVSVICGCRELNFRPCCRERIDRSNDQALQYFVRHRDLRRAIHPVESSGDRSGARLVCTNYSGRVHTCDTRRRRGPRYGRGQVLTAAVAV